MAYGIAYFVGEKRGGWAISSERFGSEAECHAEILNRVRHETAQDITPMIRRPAEVD